MFRKILMTLSIVSVITGPWGCTNAGSIVPDEAAKSPALPDAAGFAGKPSGNVDTKEAPPGFAAPRAVGGAISAIPSVTPSTWSEFFNPAPPLALGERINSWSGTGVPGTYLLCTNTGTTDRTWRFDGKVWSVVYTGPGDILRTSGNTILLFKSGSKSEDFIPVSTDGGLTWTAKYPTPQKTTGGLKPGSVLASTDYIYWADINAVFKTTDKGQTYSEEPCPVGIITSLTRARNNDLVAVGIDSSGKVRTARQKAGGTSWQIIDTPVPLSSAATGASGVMVSGYPERDSVIVTVSTKDGNSGVWITNWDSSKWARVDIGNPVNQGIGISTLPSTMGNADEGFGVTYICDQNSIVRIRGNATQSERINIPTNLGVTSVLWFAQTFVDAGTGAISPNNINIGVDIDGDGKIEKILSYRDSLNGAVTAVKASFMTPSSAVVNWIAVSGATNYAVFVSTNRQTNYYTAVNDPGIIIKYNPGDTMAWISGLSTSNYYVTVWAIGPVTSFYGSTRLTVN